MDLDTFNHDLLECQLCPRLVAWREQVAREKRRSYKDQPYWGKPVPGFGDPHARIFIVGLAPGAHGSNRTGRQFTGDASGDFFYPALYRAGLANQPNATSRDDGLTLYNVYTAPVCRCAPPDNKPTALEMAQCQPYLQAELEFIHPEVIVVLGRIAFESILRIYSLRDKSWKFSHNAVFEMEHGPSLVCSYHPSQQNTQTGRLTPAMFDLVWQTALALLNDHRPG
jgi:uracil-DNA glycosylase family 4